MKLLESAEDVSDVAFGFMASKALFSALHLNLFTILEDGTKTADEAAVEMEIHPDRATTLLTALTTLGLVGRDDGVYANSPAAQAFLVKGAKYDFGDYLRLQIDQQMYGLLDQVEEAMTGTLPDDAIASYSDWMSDPEAARLYSESQHSGSLGPARTLDRMLDLSESRTLLDVGGGTGAFAITLTASNPKLKATVIDFPNVAVLGETYVAEAGLSDQVDFVHGDLLCTEWPKGQDILLMSYILSSVPGDRIPELIDRALAALNPGGRFIIHDFMVEPNREGPKLAALWQFQHTAFNPEAKSVSTDWVAAQMDEAGFAAIEGQEMIPGMTSISMGLRPM